MTQTSQSQATIETTNQPEVASGRSDTELQERRTLVAEQRHRADDQALAQLTQTIAQLNRLSLANLLPPVGTVAIQLSPEEAIASLNKYTEETAEEGNGQPTDSG